MLLVPQERIVNYIIAHRITDVYDLCMHVNKMYLLLDKLIETEHYEAIKHFSEFVVSLDEFCSELKSENSG